MNEIEQILEANQGWLQKTARGIIGRSTDSDEEDLIQEGRITMWRALVSYDPAKSPNRDAWIKFRARNAMLKIVMRPRWQERPNPHDPETWYDRYDLPNSLNLNIESLMLAYHDDEIVQAIARLSPGQRKYVLARFWSGLTDSEMIEAGLFTYDAHAMWTSARNGARQKLAMALSHLEDAWA